MNNGILVLVIAFILINIVKKIAKSLSSEDEKSESSSSGKKKPSVDFFSELEKHFGDLDFSGEEKERPYQPYAAPDEESISVKEATKQQYPEQIDISTTPTGEGPGNREVWSEDRFEKRDEKVKASEEMTEPSSFRDVSPAYPEKGLWAEDRFETDSKSIEGDEKILAKTEEVMAGSPISRREISGQAAEKTLYTKKVQHLNAFLKSRSNLQNAILLSTILGPCRAKKQYGRN
jgi:hypothetical protein